MPGGIATPLQRHVLEADPDYMKNATERFERAGMKLKTPEQGAATSVLLAASPLVEGVGGRYFEDCNEAPVVERRPESGIGGVAAYAVDPRQRGAALGGLARADRLGARARPGLIPVAVDLEADDQPVAEGPQVSAVVPPSRRHCPFRGPSSGPVPGSGHRIR